MHFIHTKVKYEVGECSYGHAFIVARSVASNGQGLEKSRIDYAAFDIVRLVPVRNESGMSILVLQRRFVDVDTLYSDWCGPLRTLNLLQFGKESKIRASEYTLQNHKYLGRRMLVDTDGLLDVCA